MKVTEDVNWQVNSLWKPNKPGEVWSTEFTIVYSI